jgi:Zn-dependent peptidase ImmA (M78 family)/DNA-binding XRE family transcriptional regulator
MPDIENNLVIGSQLRKARELLQLTPAEAAQLIKVDEEEIEAWEKGLSRPSLKQLEELARGYGREIDYFLRKTPNPPEKIEFRGKPGQSVKSIPAQAKLILARFDELCRTAIEIERLLNKQHGVSLPKFTASDSPKTVAQYLRQNFDANDKPLANLRDHMETAGIRVFELPVPEDTFSGFSFWHLEYGPCILLNSNDPIGRRNFTLAHELAHLLYDHGSSLCYIHLSFGRTTKSIESIANQVAVELLMPKSGIVDDFQKRNLTSHPTEKELIAMAAKWNVSFQALSYRLENLNLIAQGITDKFVESKPKHFRRSKTPTWERRLGKRFVATSIEAYQKNIISIGKLAHVLQIPIRKAMERIAGVVKE